MTVAYTTLLAHRASEPVEGEERVRVRWVLPGWRSGLDGVEVVFVAPRGSRMGPRDETDTGASVDTATSDVAEGTLLRWRRAHLPRTTPWTLAVDVPSDAMIEELRAPQTTRAPAVRQSAVTGGVDPRPFWIALALLAALLACAKILAAHRLARRCRTAARPLLPLPALVRAPLAVALCGAAAWFGSAEPIVALALLAAASLHATYRPAEPARAARLGAWRPVDARWVRAVRRGRLAKHFGPGALLDATTVLGAAHLAAWLVVPLVCDVSVPLEQRICAAVLPLPMLLTGTRLAFPSPAGDSLATLLALARRLRVLPAGVALRPVVHVDVRGEVQDARVRTVLARRPRGLLRLDLVLSERLRAGGYEREPSLLVLTRAGSAAEAALAEGVPDVAATSSPGGRRVLRSMPVGSSMLARIVTALAECPEAPAVSRGTAAAQETVRDLPAPRAVGL